MSQNTDATSSEEDDRSAGEDAKRENCAMGGCLEPPTKKLHIKRGDVDWYDDYCDGHAEMQLETENAEVANAE